jgi:hypothetical protein
MPIRSKLASLGELIEMQRLIVDGKGTARVRARPRRLEEVLKKE